MKKKALSAFCGLLSASALIPVTTLAQNVYEIDAPAEPKPIYTGHLNMGGTSPDGGSIDVNSYYMSIDGKPVIPVMGEFHFSRYPAEQWEEEILKMKAGGVTVLPTYIFWNIHEEKEGVFDWSGNRDVRRFIQLCQKHDMPVIVRIGPFCHGEIRNGGLPDWLFAKPVIVRSNDPAYLQYVNRLYCEIAGQLEGLYYKDGGPVIGCQIENEHQHSAAPWAITYPGEALDFTAADYDASITKIGVSVQDQQITTSDLGDIHMKTLKDMAADHGIVTPFYTATGWGNAAVIGNEAIPVTSAYTYPFWAEPEMSPFCMFKDIHAHPDYEPVRYDGTKFPSFCAEMGAGIQMIYSRRPIVLGEAAEALMVRSLGSGSNGIGYYLYHGGSTPKRCDGTGYFSDEPMGMPKISYDFQAPLGEFGLEGNAYRTLRLLHSFLADFGDRLAPMETVLPDNAATMTPENKTDLRYAARMKDDSGFIFMVNFQDHDTTRTDLTDLQLRLNLVNENLAIPSEGSFTLPKDESLILPFNLDMNGALLKYATAQLMMKIDDKGGEHWFFFVPDGLKPEYSFDRNTVKGKSHFSVDEAGLESTFKVRTKNGKTLYVTTLTKEQAKNSCKVSGKLLITKSMVLPEDGKATLLNLGKNEFEYILYPSAAGFKTQSASVKAVEPVFSSERIGTRRMTIHCELEPCHQVQEYYLDLDYTADVAMAFMDGELALDHFWHGRPWIIGLDRFADSLKTQDMVFYFRPLAWNAPFLYDIPAEDIPDFTNGPVCNINSVEVVPQYRFVIEF